MSKVFGKFKSVMSLEGFIYKGYPLNKIICVDIISIIYNKNNLSYKKIKKMFLTKNISFNDFNEGDIYSIGDYNRSDYMQIMKYVISRRNGELLRLSDCKKIFSINPSNIIYAAYLVIFKLKYIGLSDRMNLFFSYTYAINLINKTESNNCDLDFSSIKSYTAFCSNMIDEAFINFFLKKKGITTFTLQHGLWYIFEKNDKVDILAYENLVADYLLTWGDYTKHEFEKYGVDSASLISSGYPREYKNIIPNDNILNENNVLILLSRKLFESNNHNIIKIIQEFSSETTKKYNFYFKLHPSLSHECYTTLIGGGGVVLSNDKTIAEVISEVKFSFSISYNSTSYFDSYINNCMSFRFKDCDSEVSTSILADEFSSSSELIKIIDYYSLQEQNALWELVKERLRYVLGYGVDKYDNY
jgi:hypothetical protein